MDWRSSLMLKIQSLFSSSCVLQMISEIADSCSFNPRRLNVPTVIVSSPLSSLEMILFNFLVGSNETHAESVESTKSKNSSSSIVPMMNSLFVLNSSTISWNVGRLLGLADQSFVAVWNRKIEFWSFFFVDDSRNEIIDVFAFYKRFFI